MTKSFKAGQRNERNKVVEGLQGNATQHSVAVQEREIRDIELTKGFKATQRNAAAQETEMRQIKSTKRFKATQRSAEL